MAQVHLEGVPAGNHAGLSRWFGERYPSNPVTSENHGGTIDHKVIVGHHRYLTILVERCWSRILRSHHGQVAVNNHQFRMNVKCRRFADLESLAREIGKQPPHLAVHRPINDELNAHTTTESSFERIGNFFVANDLGIELDGTVCSIDDVDQALSAV